MTGQLEVRDLQPADHEAAVGVLARGMRDNPMHVAGYGPDPERREELHARMMRALFRYARENEPIGAYRDGTLVAVAGALSGADTHPGVAQQLRFLPTILGTGPRTSVRIARWLAAWKKQIPAEEHVHLGPVAVDRHLQGRGIGSVLLREHARRLDATRTLGFLETDKPENVRFYERVGYAVVEEEDVLGVRCWFMQRRPT